MVKFENVKVVVESVISNLFPVVQEMTFNEISKEIDRVEAVITALTDSRYEMRTFAGIYKQVLTTEPAIMQILLALMELRAVEEIRREKTYYKYIK